MPLIKHLKKRIKQEGRNLDIRAQKAGCFDLCELGPVMVVYPEGHYYRVTDLETLDIVYESLTAQRPRIDANVYRIDPLQVPHVRARLKRQ